MQSRRQYVSFHLFTLARSGNFGIPLCDSRVDKAVSEVRRNFLDNREFFVPILDCFPPVIFLCKVRIESSFITDKLSFRTSSYKTICQDIAVEDLVFRPERARAKVLEKRRQASLDAQLYIILKKGLVRVRSNKSPFGISPFGIPKWTESLPATRTNVRPKF